MIKQGIGCPLRGAHAAAVAEIHLVLFITDHGFFSQAGSLFVAGRGLLGILLLYEARPSLSRALGTARWSSPSGPVPSLQILRGLFSGASMAARLGTFALPSGLCHWVRKSLATCSQREATRESCHYHSCRARRSNEGRSHPGHSPCGWHRGPKAEPLLTACCFN